MAMLCVNGARECDGCMACQEEPKEIGPCEYCGAPVCEGDEYYDIHGELVHWDCLRDWAKMYAK